MEIVTAYSCDLLVQLQHHQIDLALVTSPPEMATITTLRVATNPFMMVLREHHPLAGKASLTWEDVAQFPWVFFNRKVHPPLHDQILNRMASERREPRIRHLISNADHVPALLTDDMLLAWLTPTGAQRIARGGLCSIRLVDPDVRLETHLASAAGNTSALLSEYVRTFVRRLEAAKPSIQLELPISGDTR
jgi:DNA-binding transcriptional LysR family regulator